MRHYPGTIDFREMVLPVLAVLFLFMASIYLPFVGVFFGIWTPLPLVYAYLERGPAQAAAVLAAAALAVLTLSGGAFTVLFALEYGVMAAVMGELIRQGHPREKVALYGAVAPALCSFAAIFVFFSGTETDFFTFMKEKIEFSIRETMESYQAKGMNQEQVQVLEAYSSQIINLFVRLLPAWFIAGSLLTAAANYGVIKKIWIKRFSGASPYFRDLPFSQWMLSDYFIWALIAAGLALLLPLAALNAVGINLLFLSLLVYTISGMAVLLYWLEKNKNYHFFVLIVTVLLLIQPIFLLIIAGLGIFDIWVDFRKLRAQPPPLKSS